MLNPYFIIHPQTFTPGSMPGLIGHATPKASVSDLFLGQRAENNLQFSKLQNLSAPFSIEQLCHGEWFASAQPRPCNLLMNLRGVGSAPVMQQRLASLQFKDKRFKDI